MTPDLFGSLHVVESCQEGLGPCAVVLRGFAASDDTTLLAALQGVIAMAPFRHMITPGGFRMSVGMTNCGSLGWVTDRTGYRYDALDPERGDDWPRMPRPTQTTSSRPSRTAKSPAGPSEATIYVAKLG